MKPILKIYMNYFEKLDKLFYCKQGILELEICYQLLIDEHYNYDVSKNILYWSIIGLVCWAILMNSAFKTHVFRHQPKIPERYVYTPCTAGSTCAPIGLDTIKFPCTYQCHMYRICLENNVICVW